MSATHDDYRPWTGDVGPLERCPVCGHEGSMWQYSESPSDPVKRVVMCSNGERIGPQSGIKNEGCLLYMPPDEFYRDTAKDAARFWSEYAKALTALQRQSRAPAPAAAPAAEPAMLNGLTEAETNATASVAGLSTAPGESCHPLLVTLRTKSNYASAFHSDTDVVAWADLKAALSTAPRPERQDWLERSALERTIDDLQAKLDEWRGAALQSGDWLPDANDMPKPSASQERQPVERQEVREALPREETDWTYIEPCPQCGKPACVDEWIKPWDGAVMVRVRCTGCGHTGPDEYGDAGDVEVRKAWNSAALSTAAPAPSLSDEQIDSFFDAYRRILGDRIAFKGIARDIAETALGIGSNDDRP